MCDLDKGQKYHCLVKSLNFLIPIDLFLGSFSTESKVYYTICFVLHLVKFWPTSSPQFIDLVVP